MRSPSQLRDEQMQSQQPASRPAVDIAWDQSYKAAPGVVGFLDLPREIRDLCYEYAFTLAGAIFVYSSNLHTYRPVLKGKVVKHKSEGPLEPQPVGSAVPITLVRTCRQVHAEATEILYGCNKFRLYMSNADFASPYRTLIRNVTFTMEAGRRICGDDLEEMCYYWRRVFWPNIIERSTAMLLRYPKLDILTFPIKSDNPGMTWRPAFFPSGRKTKEQRVALAASWLRANCPILDERLRRILRLEIQPAILSEAEQKGSWFFPEENEDRWDGSELAQAWIKSL